MAEKMTEIIKLAAIIGNAYNVKQRSDRRAHEVNDGQARMNQVKRKEDKSPWMLYTWLISEMQAPTAQNKNAEEASRQALLSLFFSNV